MARIEQHEDATASQPWLAWRRSREKVRIETGSDRRSRRRRLAGMATIAGIISLAILVAVRHWELPRVEPPFERIVGEGAGPVKEFALRDAQGAEHTRAEWAGRSAIVLFFIAPECPVSNTYAPEMGRFAGAFGARGVGFYGIHTDPDVTAEVAARHAKEYRLTFPILLDPHQRVARQAGVKVTPEAVLLLPDGQVAYRGRIDDRYSPDGKSRPAAQVRELADAIEAVLADELPVVDRTRAFGCPLPRPARGEDEETITYTKHVAPILWNNCARCHRPGEVAPFSLLTYRDAMKRADFIRDVTASRRMPPWKPHPGAGVFLDAQVLGEREKEILKLWAEAGCEEGDPADLPTPPRFADGWQLGTPDIVLTMPEPFTVPADGPDLYRSFPLPSPLDRDVTIAGVEFRPDNRRVVHHNRMYLDETGDARRRDRDDPVPGFTGWFEETGLDLPYPGIGAWTAGMTPRLAPEGVGRVIPRGSDVVLQIHYHPSGKPEVDRSSIGLFFARKPVTRHLAGLSLCTDKIDIPPGEKRHKVIISARLKADVHLIHVAPHAHYLAREFRLAATLPDGVIRPLLWITDWDLNWQDQYRYARPVRLPEGTLLTLAVTFDNSDENPRNPFKPPRRIRYGVGTNDEMCACHLEFLPADAKGYATYSKRSPFGL